MWYRFIFSLGSGDPEEVGQSKTVPHPHHIDFGEELKTLVSANPVNVMLVEAVKDRAIKRVYYLYVPPDQREFDAIIKRYNGVPGNQPSEKITVLVGGAAGLGEWDYNDISKG